MLSMIVEGDSERESLPVLVRRIASSIRPGLNIPIAPPWRVPRGRLLREGGLEQHVRASARQAGVGGAVLIVVDADDDCPKELVPIMRQRADSVGGITCPISIVLAEREWESWFIASAEALRGHRGLKSDIQRPAIVEAIRDAKGWLSVRKERGYSPVLDQPALTAIMDIDSARSCSSFDKCYREITQLCAHFDRQSNSV